MGFSDQIDFSHRDREEIYEYIERAGTIGYDDARRSLNMSPEAFGHHVAVLERDGIITRDEDENLRVAFDDDSEETYVDDGIEVTIRQARLTSRQPATTQPSGLTMASRRCTPCTSIPAISNASTPPSRRTTCGSISLSSRQSGG